MVRPTQFLVDEGFWVYAKLGFFTRRWLSKHLTSYQYAIVWRAFRIWVYFKGEKSLRGPFKSERKAVAWAKKRYPELKPYANPKKARGGS